MWKQNLKSRIRKPSTIISLVSQVVALLLLVGYDLDKNIIVSVATVLCSILVTLGILSNPDTENKGYGDDIRPCSKEGKNTCHVKVNGQMVCAVCGTTCNRNPQES